MSDPEVKYLPLDGWGALPELRAFLEEQRRSTHIQVAALDRLLGYSNETICPTCGHRFVPKKIKRRDR